MSSPVTTEIDSHAASQAATADPDLTPGPDQDHATESEPDPVPFDPEPGPDLNSGLNPGPGPDPEGHGPPGLDLDDLPPAPCSAPQSGSGKGHTIAATPEDAHPDAYAVASDRQRFRDANWLRLWQAREVMAQMVLTGRSTHSTAKRATILTPEQRIRAAKEMTVIACKMVDLFGMAEEQSVNSDEDAIAEAGRAVVNQTYFGSDAPEHEHDPAD